MDYLWTPWRYAYVSTAEKAIGCVFCDAVKADDDKNTLIVHRGQFCFIILNAYPYTPGHVMVVPYAHLDELRKLPTEAADEMIALSQRIESLLRELCLLHGHGGKPRLEAAEDFRLQAKSVNVAGESFVDRRAEHLGERLTRRQSLQLRIDAERWVRAETVEIDLHHQRRGFRVCAQVLGRQIAITRFKDVYRAEQVDGVVLAVQFPKRVQSCVGACGRIGVNGRARRAHCPNRQPQP